jgi:hypothetical protein
LPEYDEGFFNLLGNNQKDKYTQPEEEQGGIRIEIQLLNLPSPQNLMQSNSIPASKNPDRLIRILQILYGNNIKNNLL